MCKMTSVEGQKLERRLNLDIDKDLGGQRNTGIP